MKIKHTDIRIISRRNLQDCTCEAVIAARTDAIYRKLWEGLTKRGAMEVNAASSDYGISGTFVFPSEAFMRKFVREVKAGKEIIQKNTEIRRDFRARYHRERKTDLPAEHRVHSVFQMTLEITIKV